MALTEYIDECFNGSQIAFANTQGVKPPQVTQWITKGYIVADNILYSPRRELKELS